MHCPFCNAADSKVIDSRLVVDGNQIRRRRECIVCHERFTTFETAELVMPRVVKHKDGGREDFNREKLKNGMLKALEKRPVDVEAIDESVSRIESKIRATGLREIDSKVIGEYVMEELKKLDEVAYVRFASVYRHFAEVEDFVNEIAKLGK